MDIKAFRENLKVKKQLLTGEILSAIQKFEAATGCCVDHISLSHTGGMLGKEDNKRTIGIFVAVDVLGEQNT